MACTDSSGADSSDVDCVESVEVGVGVGVDSNAGAWVAVGVGVEVADCASVTVAEACSDQGPSSDAFRARSEK